MLAGLAHRWRWQGEIGRNAICQPTPARDTGGHALTTALDDILVDTGTTIPGLMAAELSNTSDSTASGAITAPRGNSWTINATIGAITGYTSLWFTVKHSQDDADSDAILQIKLNSTGSDDDLLYVNGATASDSTLGTITVSDASTGAIIIAVDETVTDDMPAGAFTTTYRCSTAARLRRYPACWRDDDHRGRYPQRDIMDKQYRTRTNCNMRRSQHRGTQSSVGALRLCEHGPDHPGRRGYQRHVLEAIEWLQSCPIPIAAARGTRSAHELQ